MTREEALVAAERCAGRAERLADIAASGEGRPISTDAQMSLAAVAQAYAAAGMAFTTIAALRQPVPKDPPKSHPERLFP